MNDTRNNIQLMLQMGMSGSAEDFFNWHKLYTHISDYSFPKDDPRFQNFHSKISELFSSTEATLEEVKEILEKQVFLELATYSTKTKTYTPILNKDNIFLENFFLVHRDQNFSGIQMVRSVFMNIFIGLGAKRNRCQDFSIAITEAIENAVKYSKHELIAVGYQIKDKRLIKYIETGIFNGYVQRASAKNPDAKKFKEGASLMRGVLMMSSLFDKVEIEYNPQYKVMEFFSTYKVMKNKTFFET